MASLQRLITLWKNNQFIPGEQNAATAVPKNANAREELFERVVEDKDIVPDVRDGISLLHNACNAIAATQAFKKQPDEYSPDVLITHDFLLLAHVLRLFFPREMMDGFRKSTTHKSTAGVKRPFEDDDSPEGPKKKQNGFSFGFSPSVTGVKRSLEDDDSSEGPKKKQNGFSFGFSPSVTGVKRSLEDDDSSEGLKKKQNGFGFSPSITGVKQSLEDYDSSEGPKKKQNGFSFGFAPPIARVKRSLEDECRLESSSKKQKSLGRAEGFGMEFTFDALKVKQEPED